MAVPEQHRPGRADSLVSLGIRLWEQGRPADALLAEQDAVTISRELAAADPERYRPDLANALTNLSISLLDLDRPVDVLPTGRSTGSWPPKILASSVPG